MVKVGDYIQLLSTWDQLLINQQIRIRHGLEIHTVYEVMAVTGPPNNISITQLKDIHTGNLKTRHSDGSPVLVNSNDFVQGRVRKITRVGEFQHTDKVDEVKNPGKITKTVEAVYSEVQIELDPENKILEITQGDHRIAMQGPQVDALRNLLNEMVKK